MVSVGGGTDLAARQLAEQARTMRGVLSAGALLLAVLVVLAAVAGIGVRAGLLIYGSGLLLHLVHLAALRRAWRVRPVAISFCILYVVWVTAILGLHVGGLRAQAGMVYPPIVLLAGLIWSGSAAIGMAVVCSAVSAALLVLERQGILHGGPPITPFHLWQLVTTVVVISAVILRYAVGVIARSTGDAVRSQQRLADLVRLAPDAMMFTAAGHVVRACNPAAEALFGWPAADLVGKPFEKLVSPDEDQQRLLAVHLAAAAGGSAPVPLEVTLRRLDGGDVLVELRARRVVHGGDGAELHLTVRDLRDRTRAEAERRRLEEQLRQAQRLEALGRMAGGVAHDFNNLLTVILGSTDLIQLGTPAAGTYLREIENAAHSAADLTRQLLAFGRRQLLTAETVDVNRAVDGMQGMLRRLLPENIAFAVELAEAPALISVDRVQLEQVLLNLVANARDAVEGGGSVMVRVSLARPGDLDTDGADLPAAAVWLTVADDGAGMTDEVKAHAFEPFYTTKEAAKGAGLGLASVHGIVTQSGGQIYLESAAGRGTMVAVVFPRSTPGGAHPRVGGERDHRDPSSEAEARSSS